MGLKVAAIVMGISFWFLWAGFIALQSVFRWYQPCKAGGERTLHWSVMFVSWLIVPVWYPERHFMTVPRCCSSKSYFAKRGQDYVVLFPPASPIRCLHITRSHCSAISPFLMLPSLSVSVSSLPLEAVVVVIVQSLPLSSRTQFPSEP